MLDAMPQNIEIKARIGCLTDVLARAAALSDRGPTDIAQDDTFFACDLGRLKLREFGDGTGELIFYRREDVAGPKPSFYVRAPSAEPTALREALSLAYGVVGRVRKQRRLFLVGRTRIHVDSVEDLGDFLELEVVLEAGEAPALGTRQAEDLMVRLGIAPDQWVRGAYVDLLRR
jgi:adenylate cyclase class IV